MSFAWCLGALVASTRGTEFDTGLDLVQVQALNEYWEECRGLYAPFESGQKTGSADVVRRVTQKQFRSLHVMQNSEFSSFLLNFFFCFFFFFSVSVQCQD